MSCSPDVSINYLVRSANPAGLSGLYVETAAGNQITRLLTDACPDSKESRQKAKPMIRQMRTKLPQGKFSVLIVDESCAEKPHSDASALITAQYSHFFASKPAYIKLEALPLNHSIGHFRIRVQQYADGLKAMHQLSTALN